MNKHEFIRAVAADADVSIATVERVMRSVEDVVLANLGDKTETNFGFMKVKTSEKPARTARNPSTGAVIQIAAKTSVRVVPMLAMKKAANGG